MNLGARLAIVLASVAAATALLVGGASYLSTDRQVLAEIDNFLEERAEEIIGGERAEPNDRRDRGRDRNRNNNDVFLGITPDAEVQIINGAGLVESNTGVLLPVSDEDTALADKEGQAVLRTVSVDGREFRMLSAHITEGRVLQVARSLDESSDLLGALQPTLLVVAGAMAALAAVAGWILAQRTTRPLRALTGAVDEVAQTRDFSVPVPVSGEDEVGRLARGFNRMLDALQNSEEQQRRLVQDAAHELRTPLTSITANVDWLMRAPDLPAEARTDTLQSVRRELTELNGVIAEIIELATDSRQAPERVELDLATVVDDAVDQFRARTGRPVQVISTPTRIHGDADGLHRAVTNLLSNADKYSPDASPIDVEVSAAGVFVSDAGPGIPVDERSKIFDRFYRRDEDRSKPGSGLGLSIVAGIVEQHGGVVLVNESERGGARVGFAIPGA